jgi:tetratricopeptide (TPR) repeat protein
MDLQELIDDYLDGRLSPKDRKLFEDLIEENPQYKSELVAKKNGRAAVELVEKGSLRPAVKSWLISTAIAFLLVAMCFFLWTTLGMSPGEKLFAKYYDTPARQSVADAPFFEDSTLISDAFRAYDLGDFEKAGAMFEQAKIPPNSGYVLFYSGICQLELGRPEKAIPLFSLISTNSETISKEEASWYEALGYFKLNMLEKGKNPLKITAANPNPYQERAEAILKSLK